MERKFWVDAVKAVCMIIVYLLHSQIYSGWSGRGLYLFCITVLRERILFCKRIFVLWEMALC